MVKRALIVGALSLAACFKGGSSKPTPPPGNTSSVAKAPDYSATIADPVGFLPVDSEVVIGLDVDALRRSALWPMLSARLATSTGSELGGFKAVCGFDPIATVHSMTIGFKNLKQDAPEGVIVISGLDRPKLTACATKVHDKDARALTVDNGIFVMADPKASATRGAFAFVDASTIVGVVGPTAGKPQLQAVLAAGVPLRTSGAFNELLKLTDLEGALWGMMNGASSIFDQAQGALGMRPKAVVGSLSLASGLALSMRLRLDTAAQATQLQQMVNGQIGMARGMFDKLDVTSDGADVVVAATMNDQQLSSMLQLLGGAFGGP